MKQQSWLIQGKFSDGFIKYLQKYWGLSEKPDIFSLYQIGEVTPRPYRRLDHSLLNLLDMSFKREK